MSDDGWTWELSATAQDDLDALSPDDRDRILDKLDEIVDSPWRDPPEYGEPLRNSPYRKIRIGEFRLSVTFRENEGRLVVARIKTSWRRVHRRRRLTVLDVHAPKVPVAWAERLSGTPPDLLV